MPSPTPDTTPPTSAPPSEVPFPPTVSPPPSAPSPPAGAPVTALDCSLDPSGPGAGPAVGACARGFAEGVTGGSTPYLVTSAEDVANDDAPEGTFRRGAYFPGTYVTFADNMDIYLKPMRVVVGSNVTVDGRGRRIRIFLSFDSLTQEGSPLYLYGVTNVIFVNIEFIGTTGTSHILYLLSASKVWADHCKFSTSDLGTVNLFRGSTDVTISNSRFPGTPSARFVFQFGNTEDVTQTVSLDGASDDRSRRVTLYRNVFENHYGGAPLARFGVVHVVNNLYRNWGNYSIHGRRSATLLSESNVYVPLPFALEVTQHTGRDSPTDGGWDNSSSLLTKNDWFQNGATFFVQTYNGASYTPPYAIDTATANQALQDFLDANAGPQYPPVMPPPPPSPPVPPPPPSLPPPTDCIYTIGMSGDVTSCAMGFAMGIVGGKNGTRYTVTTAAWSNEAGSLYNAIFTPSYVTFDGDYAIDTQGNPLYFRDGTTVDGRGRNVTISMDHLNVYSGGYNLELIFININFIINGANQPYGVYIGSATNVWFDHCTFTVLNPNVRTLAVVSVSNTVPAGITVSNSLFTSAGSPIRIGTSDQVTQDAAMQVTLYRNWFRGSATRLVEVRYARLDLVNNLFADWGTAALAPRFAAKVYSEANVYTDSDGGANATAVSGADVNADNGYRAMTRSTKDFFPTGATFLQSQAASVSNRSYAIAVAPADDVLEAWLKTNAGPQTMAPANP